MNELITEIVAAALTAVNPATAIHRQIVRSGDMLTVADRVYNLAESEIRCIALGKAAVPMAQAMAEILGSDLACGLVVTKSNHLGAATFPATWEMIEAGHPIPDERSLSAGDRVWDFLANCTERTIIVAGISGGASALVAAPRTWCSLGQLLIDPVTFNISPEIPPIINAALAEIEIDMTTIDPDLTISLTALQAINTALLNSGLNIELINAVRSQLDRLKGGGFVNRALPGKVSGLILSDVIGDPIASIASGLTNHPAAHNTIIGSNHQACVAVATTVRNLGYDPQIVTTELEGEARDQGREIASKITTKPSKTVLIYGGETTVTLPPDCLGKGGRNQELALAAAIELSTQSTPAWVVTLATDGTDGPTDAAGAIVNEQTIEPISLGLAARAALDLHDSYPFFNKLGNLHRIGATGTNVADITIAIRP